MTMHSLGPNGPILTPILYVRNKLRKLTQTRLELPGHFLPDYVTPWGFVPDIKVTNRWSDSVPEVNHFPIVVPSRQSYYPQGTGAEEMWTKLLNQT